MNDLTPFFKNNEEAEDIIVDYVVSKRYRDNNGKPIPWKIRKITDKEKAQMFIKTIRIPKKRNMYKQVNNLEKLSHEFVAASIVFPDLNDKELQQSYGVGSSKELLQKMLLIGEYDNLVRFIVKLNSLDGGL